VSVPTPTEGFLVIEPDSSTNFECIYYTSKTGAAVICPSAAAGRGQDDSTAASHTSGASVRMDTTAGMFEVLQNMSAVGTNAITADKLATSAITLGYAQITSDFTTTSTTAVQVTGLSVTVTIPAGGRRVKITAYTTTVSSNTSAVTIITLWDGAVVSGTQIGQANRNTINTASNNDQLMCMAIVTPAAGSKTYNVGLHTTAGTATLGAAANGPAFILVEAI